MRNNLASNASDTSIGAVLLQGSLPIAYFSKKLGPRRCAASTYHKELYAIVEAVQKWRKYLLGPEFVIRSDQKSLKELLQKIVHTPDQHLYVWKLMGYKFSIQYKKGTTNRAADALSCREESESGEASSSAPPGSVVDLDEGRSGSLLVAAAHPFPQLINLLRRETTSLRRKSERERESAASFDAGGWAGVLPPQDFYEFSVIDTNTDLNGVT